MTKYVLPDLPYDYAALEPHISGRIMELHHDKHHKGYVDGANKALEQLEEARSKSDFTRIAALEKALAFNVSGHVLHSLFWNNMTPNGGDQPQGELAEALKRDFGSFDAFKKQMTAVAATNMGSGWAALVWDPLSSRLLTAQIHDHQSETLMASVPLMVIDAWEHAWYLQYQNEKAKFFDAIWNVWNWNDIAKRYAEAQKLSLALEAPQAGGTPRRPASAPQPSAGRA
ncbi:MAG TPA: superoxide dismutase [Steroidobacteraceae bacterium]|jgi:Fe-Mn family superoxide dismutase|nr:superoxide dismutase [Steroidobacteraceae bacterium]